MPKTQFSKDLHSEKYGAEGEDFRSVMDRNAGAVTNNDEEYQELRELTTSQRYIMAGRNQACLGSIRGVTPFNCFASGIIADSYVDGPGSIMDRAKEAAATMRMGGGIGHDFSTLRPRGAVIKKLGSVSSGPLAFMDIFDAIGRCTASAGDRRGAQMGILRVDHPCIEEFILAKQTEGRLTGFNISVGLTDEFMVAVENDADFDLRWGGEVYKKIKAKALWNTMMRSTWDWAEPGVLFLDRINEMNNLHYCEDLCAVNPCAEQPLPPHGACLLGSFNLTQYLTLLPNNKYGFNWVQFGKDIPIAVRAMDRVIDIASFPLPEQKEEALNKRRMGLGVTGAANAIEAMGRPYGSEGFVNLLTEILTALRNGTYRASIELAKELGPFPAFDGLPYWGGLFIGTLPVDIRDDIAKYGIRNSHLLSIAPTGTISLCADNVSSGVEPVTFLKQKRIFQKFSGPVEMEIEDYGVAFLGHTGKTIADCSIADHLAVLECATKYVDSAVSKTVNIPDSCSWEEFQNVYMDAWKRGCKGITTYRAAGKRKGIISDGAACEYDPETGQRSCE